MSKLSRKKVKVRTKSGKTFMRSIMMKSDNGGNEIGAWGILRRHGAQVVARSGTAGAVGGATGTVVGNVVARKTNSATAGYISTFLASRFAGQAVINRAYDMRSARVQAMARDLQRSTAGGKVAFLGLHYVANMGASLGVGHMIHRRMNA